MTVITVSGVTSWQSAMTQCPRNSHGVTIGSTLTTSALAALVRSLAGSQRLFLGGVQTTGSADLNRGWNWIDGTPSDVLNCGVPGAQSCGLWDAGHPK